MLINVDPCFGKLPVRPIYKNSINHCLVAMLYTSALLCMPQTAFSALEAAKTEATQTTIAYTGRVQAGGVASIGAAGRNAARQAALSDALRNVAASASAQAVTGEIHPTHGYQQNPDMQPVLQGNRYSILREWESQGMYHVMVSAEVVKGKFDEKNATLAQPPKKKIAITQFDVANTIHVDDISNIYDGFPVALSNRMERSRRFLPTYTGRSIPMEVGVAQREAITQIAGETGAQFLISGIVTNAGISREKWSLNTPLGSPEKRHIEVEFSIFDGMTGNRILLRRLREQADGDVTVGNDKPFGSSIFLATEFGKATSKLIDSAVREIQEAVENVPFSAHIIKVEGKKVFIDAGSDSLLEPGDKLVAYAIDTRIPVSGLQGSMLGVAEHPADTTTLIQVKPQFSIGELPESAEKLGIKAGDIARINFADQRDLTEKRIAAQQLAKAQQEAKAEAARAKAEQAALAEAARIRAEQATLAEAARIKADKKAAAKAKAAKLKAQQEAQTTKRISAAQQARARALAVRLKAAQKAKAQAEAEAKAAKSKEAQETGAEASQGKPVQNMPETQTTETKPAKPENVQKNTGSPLGKTDEQKEQVRPESQTATKDKVQKTLNNEDQKEKAKRKILPPGEEALRGKTKSSKP
ncbi:MAG: flagella assembly protein FlgT middle domain-containing protein [Gallionella sp.]